MKKMLIIICVILIVIILGTVVYINTTRETTSATMEYTNAVPSNYFNEASRQGYFNYDNNAIVNVLDNMIQDNLIEPTIVVSLTFDAENQSQNFGRSTDEIAKYNQEFRNELLPFIDACKLLLLVIKGDTGDVLALIKSNLYVIPSLVIHD